MSYDIALLESKIPLIGSTAIPTGIDETGILFTDINPNATFITPPHLMITARFNPNTPYIYGMSYSSVTNTGVKIDFSAKILEHGHYLDFSFTR
jgi:hypothetical protein